MTAARTEQRVEAAESVSPWAIGLAVVGFLLVGTRQAFTVPLTGLGLSTAQLALLLLVLAWVATRALGQRAPAGLGLLTVIVVVRWACLLISYGLASVRGLRSDLQASADRTVLTELVAALAVFVLVTLLRTARDVEVLLQGLVAGGALSSLFAIVQYGTGVDLAAKLRPPGFAEQNSVLATALLREGLVRAQGAAAHPLELGAVTATLVPIGLGLVFAARHTGAPAWPWVVATALLAGGGAVSLSRSTFLGIGVALLVMTPRWPVRRAGVVLGGLVVAALAAVAAAPRLYEAVQTLFTQGSNDYSLQSRADGRSYVWAHFAEHFWLGQGPGTYDLSTQQVLDNQYLSQLMETGVIGMLLLVALLACALGYALRASARRVPGVRGELGSAVAGALAAILVVSFVLDTAGFTQMSTLIWLTIAVAAALWRIETGGITRAAAPAR